MTRPFKKSNIMAALQKYKIQDSLLNSLENGKLKGKPHNSLENFSHHPEKIQDSLEELKIQDNSQEALNESIWQEYCFSDSLPTATITEPSPDQFANDPILTLLESNRQTIHINIATHYDTLIGIYKKIKYIMSIHQTHPTGSSCKEKIKYLRDCGISFGRILNFMIKSNQDTEFIKTLHKRRIATHKTLIELNKLQLTEINKNIDKIDTELDNLAYTYYEIMTDLLTNYLKPI